MTIDQLLAELERQLAERRERKGVDMSDLVKRLRIKAGMIEMGEMIAWGSDSALMREAANVLEGVGAPAVQGEPDVEALVDVLESALGSFDDWCEGQDPSDIADAMDTFPWVTQARTALSAHRKQEGN